ncbi:MAG: hypothetical protein PWQ39_66 [Thermacetogenium sp.]|jgi:alkylhydroperoxidase/carboxymuconolactone decarboxylase family protein YurZ|nr:hypothetical protein [Thermacetogenium sp.]
MENLLYTLEEGRAELQKRFPEIMKGFQGIARGVHREGALSLKFKELIGIAVSVAIRCQP